MGSVRCLSWTVSRRQFVRSTRESGVTSGVAQTQAESAVMASTAAKFETVNSSLTSMLNNLMSELSVLSSAWKGMAAGEFEKVKTQYAKDLGDLNRALAETAEAIRTSGVSYDASDRAAASRVTKSGGSYTLPL
jgi:WXG100 family type VII secretion target